MVLKVDIPEAPAICPVCLSANIELITLKGDDFWYECMMCGTALTGQEAPQLIGGTLQGAEEIRNANGMNMGRLLRLDKHVNKYHDGEFLDYGCGNGMLVAFVNSRKYKCDGYDKFNPAFSSPPTKQYDGVFLVETIEHLTNPDEVLTEIHSLLKPNGYLYLESSFRWNQTLEELMKWGYVDSALGHSTIISEKGLPILFGRNGFELAEKVNNNVFIWKRNA